MLQKKYLVENLLFNFALIFGLMFALSAFVSAQKNITPLEFEYNFYSSLSGWSAGFADYPAGSETLYGLFAGPRFMPRKLTHVAQRAFYIQGHNHSDDLFMFIKRRLGPEDGIAANTTYRVQYVIIFASNAPTGCFGVGGAPGEGVALKAGASPIEPVAVLQKDGYLRMNIDKGNQ